MPPIRSTRLSPREWEYKLNSFVYKCVNWKDLLFVRLLWRKIVKIFTFSICMDFVLLEVRTVACWLLCGERLHCAFVRLKCQSHSLAFSWKLSIKMKKEKSNSQSNRSPIPVERFTLTPFNYHREWTDVRCSKFPFSNTFSECLSIGAANKLTINANEDSFELDACAIRVRHLEKANRLRAA